MKKNKRGGARKGAGRKPLKDRNELVISIPIWVRKKHIKLLGGENKFKTKIYNYIDHEVSLAVNPL